MVVDDPSKGTENSVNFYKPRNKIMQPFKPDHLDFYYSTYSPVKTKTHELQVEHHTFIN